MHKRLPYARNWAKTPRLSLQWDHIPSHWLNQSQSAKRDQSWHKLKARRTNLNKSLHRKSYALQKPIQHCLNWSKYKTFLAWGTKPRRRGSQSSFDGRSITARLDYRPNHDFWKLRPSYGHKIDRRCWCLGQFVSNKCNSYPWSFATCKWWALLKLSKSSL